MNSQFRRPLNGIPKNEIGFADGYPLLVISQASLEDLNQRLEFPVEMNRFRPNIVIEVCQPYDEDKWYSI
ncbi:MAG: MOSC domain-containing protein [Verrucomicrobiota bacterium]|nr:MOSC domain-containing protein [Verrucomicrobiota bacterium]